MKIIKVTFNNASYAYQTPDMETTISGTTEVGRESYDLPQETFDKLMNEPDKWELVKADNEQGFILKEK